MTVTDPGICRNFRPLKAVALLLAALAVTNSASAQTFLLHDTFNGDTVGAAPTGPEVGGATYGTGILVGTRIGDYTVVDVAGRRQLQVTPLGPVGDPSNGTLIEYDPLPSASPGRHVHYDFEVQTGGDSDGINGWIQELTLGPLGTNLQLDWSSSTSGRELFLATSTPGCCGGGFDTRDLGMSYATGTRYGIDWWLDTATDRYSLYVDNIALVTNASFGDDAQPLMQLVFDSNFTVTGSALVDEVSIQTVPEPATWVLMLASVAGWLVSRWLRAGAGRSRRSLA